MIITDQARQEHDSVCMNVNVVKTFDCQYLFQYSKVAACLSKVSLLLPCATAANWEQAQCLCLPQSYDGFFLPNSRALLPTFSTNCPDGVSFCPDGVSFCPDFHPQPLFFTPPSHTPFGDMYVHKTAPTPPHPTPKHPFSKTASRPAPPCARPPVSCSALKNALQVVHSHLQSAPARAAEQMWRCASCSVYATA